MEKWSKNFRGLPKLSFGFGQKPTVREIKDSAFGRRPEKMKI